FCLSSTSRRPPVSTTFTYTTLFRSGTVHELPLFWPFERDPSFGIQHYSPDDHGRKGTLTLAAFLENISDIKLIHFNVGFEYEEQDRKSTRLNSSHEWISYVVLCFTK